MSDKEYILALEEENLQLKEAIKLLTDKVAFLTNLIQTSHVKKDSHNSSMPPSSDFAKPNQSLRTKSDRKSGGQNGHTGNTLKMSSNPDKHIVVQDSFCKACGNNLSGEIFYLHSKRQIVDIPPTVPVYTEYQQMACRCSKCGKKSLAAYPNDAKAAIQYGTNIQTFIAYLSVYQSVPYFRLKKLLEQMFSLSISEGTIENILNRVAKKCRVVYNQIKTEIGKSAVIGSDETGCKVNSKKHWMWVWQNAINTFIVPSHNRGFETIQSVFADGLPNATLVCDRWAAQLKMMTKNNQICLAHLQRELVFLEETEKLPFATSFKELISSIYKLKQSHLENGKACIKGDEKSLEIEKQLSDLLLIPICKDKAAKTLVFQNSMLKNHAAILPCIYSLDIPPDNNASERAIRIIKVKQKVSGQFKTGQDAFAIIRSVIDTLKKRGLDIMTNFKVILDLKTIPE